MGIKVDRKRVARLLRMLGLAGVSHRPKRGHRPAAAVHEDLAQRKFVAYGPDRLWCTDITEHPTRSGGGQGPLRGGPGSGRDVQTVGAILDGRDLHNI